LEAYLGRAPPVVEPSSPPPDGTSSIRDEAPRDPIFLIDPPTEETTEAKHWVLFGPTRAGKSTLVYGYAFKHGLRVYSKGRGKWWDGYDGHDIVLVDDFDGKGNDMPITWWLNVMDIFPYRVEVKGGFTMLDNPLFYFTSNIHPDNWWYDAPSGNREAFMARFKNKIEILKYPITILMVRW
jgi:hypothetical protein